MSARLDMHHSMRLPSPRHKRIDHIVVCSHLSACAPDPSTTGWLFSDPDSGHLPLTAALIPPITIRVLTSFAEVRQAVPQLAVASAGQNMFCTLAWFENLVEHGFERQARLHLLLGTDNTGKQYLLPLVAGHGLTSLSNYYSSLYGPVQTVSTLPAEFLAQVSRHIRQDKARWAFVNLQPLAAESSFASETAASFSAAGYWTGHYACFGNWYLEVQGRSFAQYYGTLPSKLRHTVARGRARLTRAGGWSICIYPSAEHDLATGLQSYETVYASSWKQTEPFPGFIPSLCRMAAAHGWLRLGILVFDGQPVAAQLWIVKDGIASIYKLAYDARFSRFSPGSVLSAHMMEHSIDQDRVREVDYLTGDDAYKKDWMSHRRERIGMIAFNPATLRGLVAGAWHFMKKWIKQLSQRDRLRSPMSQRPMSQHHP